jgi:hypothetical protein
VSVRKRVIKILKDICLEFPDYPRIPEICVKIIRRINDEEGIRKLVMEAGLEKTQFFFLNPGFFPTLPRTLCRSPGLAISRVGSVRKAM